MHGTSLYTRWRAMIQRCYSPRNIGYKHYGGRGIVICQEWRKFENFMQWALSFGYKESLSLDRIDVNGNYEPANCRWISAKDQCNNRRCNQFITFDGERHTVAEWAERRGIRYSTLLNRFNSGWTPEQCLNIPVDYKNRISDGTAPISN